MGENNTAHARFLLQGSSMQSELGTSSPAPATTPLFSLNRVIVLSRARFEVAAYIILITASIIAHLWALGSMALHHDESIHAYMSWKFYSGQGGSFRCANEGTSPTYCYDPVYHGPSLYVFTFLSYFLFGDGDAQARLPMAVAGVLMVASCWMLRPYLGRRGALIAAALLGFSPSLLYYTRFARHDGLMVLWELCMVIGFFRYVDTGKPPYLYLLSVATALAVATHELYYILFFIFGMFIIVRLLSEWDFQLHLGTFTLRPSHLPLAGLLVCIFLIFVNPPLPIGQGLYLGDKALMIGIALLLGWLGMHAWNSQPWLITRIRTLVHTQLMSLWIAISLFAIIYLVLYTTFFTYPRGAIDGLYTGLAYWLLTQHDFARGDQPWYYYLMQLPLYEPLSIIASIIATAWLLTYLARTYLFSPPSPQSDPDQSTDSQTNGNTKLLTHTLPIFPIFLLFWYVNAVVIFSWAGEKMPWLLVHMSLPGNLLAAWVAGRLLHHATSKPKPSIPSHDDQQPIYSPIIHRWLTLIIPPTVLLLLASLGVAWWRLSLPMETQADQSQWLQGLVPLAIAAILIFALLTVPQILGKRATASLISLTVFALLSLYMIHATWLVVYTHPDTPIEPLIYVQTAPDVPRYVADIRELAINQTRNYRSKDDVAGGLGMPLVIDLGESGGGLTWPMQWYFRDFRNIAWRSSSSLRTATPQTFDVTLPNGETGPAPVVMFHRSSHITQDTYAALRPSYTQPYGPSGIFNWWFPEGDKCSPASQGYKRFYLNSWMSDDTLRKHCSDSFVERVRSGDVVLHSPWTPLFWPFYPEHLSPLANYLLYRTLPPPNPPDAPPLKLGSRDMEVWMRNDLFGGTTTTTQAPTLLPLRATHTYGSGTLNVPTDVAVGADGSIYIADTGNSRVVAYTPEGVLAWTAGTFGHNDGQFYEPHGIAVDENNMIYVADTWNGRIVKLSSDGKWLDSWGTAEDFLMENDTRRMTSTGGTREGNLQTPLGFFGPRGITAANGLVYIADTGNKRIVVTDDEGNYQYQWGFQGSSPGTFNEPTDVDIDANGNVVVADTWNGRVQVFAQEQARTSEAPFATWQVRGWESNTYDNPSIAVAPDGMVYLTIPQQFAALAATQQGTIALQWGGSGTTLASLQKPSGITVGPNGNVYVVDREAGRILRFSPPSVLVDDS